MNLGKLAANRNASQRKRIGDGFECRSDTLWALVEHESRIEGFQALQNTSAFPLFAREEGTEIEGLGGKTAGHIRSGNGGTPGKNLHGGTGVARSINQALARVGNPGHARIGGEADNLPVQNALDNLAGALGYGSFIQTLKAF